MIPGHLSWLSVVHVVIVVFAFHHGVAILVFCTFALEVFDIRLTFIINPPAPVLFGCKGGEC